MDENILYSLKIDTEKKPEKEVVPPVAPVAPVPAKPEPSPVRVQPMPEVKETPAKPTPVAHHIPFPPKAKKNYRAFWAHPLLASFSVGVILSFLIYLFVPFSLEERAKRGSLDAQYEFAIENYRNENYEPYLMWMKRASDTGMIAASYHLGLFYKDSSLYQDYKKAETYLTRAADKDFLQAQVLLGTMYKEGLGSTQDYKKAAHYLKLAADKGDKTAAFHLATLYLLGQGVPQDYKQAHHYALVCESDSNSPLIELIESKMKN